MGSAMREIDLFGKPLSPSMSKANTGKEHSPSKVISQPVVLGGRSGRVIHTDYQLPDAETHLGNLVEIYDAVPRFFESRTVHSLENMNQEITSEVRSMSYTLTITAATIRKKYIEKQPDGTTLQRQVNVGMFPGVREEFVEKAIRKFSTFQAADITPERCIVRFSLYELKKELDEFGHRYSYSEIREALQVLAQSNVRIVATLPDGTSLDISSGYINNLVIRSPRRDSAYYQAGNDDSRPRCQVELHPLIAQQVKRGEFRLYQYGLDMSITSGFGRGLLRFISMYWKNASESNSFRFTMMEFFASGSNRRPGQFIAQDNRQLKRAIDSLINVGMLKPDFRVVPIKASKGRKILDYEYEVYATNKFVTTVIEANSGAARRRLVQSR
tara:strand:+ start:3011 stop:4165 length:1155 start_codon:yes stop_codon:yes gene_type:complete